jgi:predicted nuclease of restriction endonuclease-like (RecB) superfamily
VQEPLAQLTLGYLALLEDLKKRIRTAQVKAALSVNRELVLLYWEIGRQILESQRREGWGAKVIDRLSQDLRQAFEDATGFSPRNLKYMRAFAEAWPDEAFVQAALAQITWYHNITIWTKSKIRRYGNSTSTRPPCTAGPGTYSSTRSSPASTSGRVRLSTTSTLLFYHLRLRCFVVVDLKAGEFQPEHAGKMSFYLSAVDHQLCHPDDQPTVGLILCKTKSKLVAEYTLRGIQSPVGVATYQRMPEHLRGALPSPAELEAVLETVN